MLTDLNRHIEHSLLAPDASREAILRLCHEAIEFNFRTVVVNPVWIPEVSSALAGSDTAIVSVAGFPLGASRTDVKLFEATKAIEDGASEIDIVANIGRMADNDFSWVRKEIETIREELLPRIALKVIVEAGKLSTRQLQLAARIVIDSGAQFVKTCTGFFGGATVEQVRTLHAVTRDRIQIKASGGIRTLEDCRRLIEAGADRLGTSASVKIMQELRDRR